ncbi:xanthine dehydrogenase family protein molybdopterin-binding subunit [Mesorhizobium escarrei]|uniref:Isoquinoline 1-oxidoreductase beta subunit n=1 Tax=Mesorhizobium escarrei TaxID=666018 RepID=A0ABN8KAP1_9HYPH|nr:molybdopterin cofactor-binding domain-containing protein [Mesorhizobium escarrei]CAH2406210.1 Isoquinoline 1-oxidoreductase beta subunit [Mesorhizobium escarrei]
MTAGTSLSRRYFLKTTAAAFGTFALSFAARAPAETFDPTRAPHELGGWVMIYPSNDVVIRISRSEMGQGSLTGLAQLLVEELECDWSQVRTEYASPRENLVRGEFWGDFQTGGSGSIRELHEPLRQAGATARVMLVAAAARLWDVAERECSVAAGTIRHMPSGRSVSFGEVAHLAAETEPPANVSLKRPEDWRILGQPLRRLDTPDKLTGKQLYCIDVALPGMLNAAVQSCPVFGGKLRGFNADVARSMPGVRHVLTIDDTAVVVVADRWWQASTALGAVEIEWDPGPYTTVNDATISDRLREGLDAEQGYSGTTVGEALSAIEGSERVITADYSYPYQAHAAMEPINATALYTSDRCEIWAPTQHAGACLETIAEASGLPAENCEVHRLHLGGGFGRRLYHDYARMAVLIAKQMPGTPVKMIWSREEDMTHDYYHPVTRCRLTGALDAEGGIAGLHMRISGQSISGSIAPHRLVDGQDPRVFHGLYVGEGNGTLSYGIPNLLIDHVMFNPSIRPGSWRGVNLNQNLFYFESFVDELAHAAGRDPLDFRLEMMSGHPKHRAVLEAAAERGGWRQAAPEGVFRGIAVANGYGSYVAAVAEVSLKDTLVRLDRLVVAIDVGNAANPELIARQAEGACAFGLSAALYGQCTVEGGAIQQTNFDTYRVLRLAEMPRVETVVLQSRDFWGGGGEPPIAVATPAVMNAVFAATGQRIRHLPLAGSGLIPT